MHCLPGIAFKFNEHWYLFPLFGDVKSRIVKKSLCRKSSHVMGEDWEICIFDIQSVGISW